MYGEAGVRGGRGERCEGKEVSVRGGRCKGKVSVSHTLKLQGVMSTE